MVGAVVGKVLAAVAGNPTGQLRKYRSFTVLPPDHRVLA